jgi:hypothetical protein
MTTHANKRVKIVESADYPETVGFMGTVDVYGLHCEGRGYMSGGVILDKLDYYFYPFVRVEVKEAQGKAVLGYD